MSFQRNDTPRNMEGRTDCLDKSLSAVLQLLWGPSTPQGARGHWADLFFSDRALLYFRPS